MGSKDMTIWVNGTKTCQALQGNFASAMHLQRLKFIWGLVVVLFFMAEPSFGPGSHFSSSDFPSFAHIAGPSSGSLHLKIVKMCFSLLEIGFEIWQSLSQNGLDLLYLDNLEKKLECWGLSLLGYLQLVSDELRFRI